MTKNLDAQRKTFGTLMGLPQIISGSASEFEALALRVLVVRPETWDIIIKP